MTPEHEDWNWAVLMTHQALIGAISPNMRRIALTFDGKNWVLRVWLLEDDAADREEIDDVCVEFEGMLADIRDRIAPIAYTGMIADIIVTRQDLVWAATLDLRPIFGMREGD